MSAKKRARENSRQIAGHFPPEVRLALMRLGVDRDATFQVLLAEALNLLFEKHGMPRCADETPRARGGAAHRRKQEDGSDDN